MTESEAIAELRRIADAFERHENVTPEMKKFFGHTSRIIELQQDRINQLESKVSKLERASTVK